MFARTVISAPYSTVTVKSFISDEGYAVFPFGVKHLESVAKT